MVFPEYTSRRNWNKREIRPSFACTFANSLFFGVEEFCLGYYKPGQRVMGFRWELCPGYFSVRVVGKIFRV